MKFLPTTRRVHQLLRAVKAETLIPQPPFQRRIVWTSKDQENFLDTVLKGYPFPEIYIAAGEVDTESAESTEHLVDGQQRITTLYRYFFGNPGLKLSKGFPTFHSLNEEQKSAFLGYEVAVRDLGKMTHDEIVDVFRRINATQYSLNDTEIQHARFTGDFMQLAMEISEMEFFRTYRVFTPQQIRRMQDVNFALSIMVTIMSTYFNRENEIESYLIRFNEEFEERDRLLEEIVSVLDFIQSCDFELKSRVSNRSDLFSLIVEVHRILFRERNYALIPAETKENLEYFFYEVENKDEDINRRFRQDVLEGYHRAAVQATNDRGNRIRRGRVIHQILTGVEPENVELPRLLRTGSDSEADANFSAPEEDLYDSVADS
jgi:hypothetical protein